MRFKELSTLLSAAALVGISAAAGADTTGRADSDSTKITVRVVNQNWLDMRVYAITSSGAYDRLGTVTSFASAEFDLAGWLDAGTRDIRLLAVPVGSREKHVSAPIMVSPGDQIEWRVENNLALSSVRVWRRW